MRTSLIMQEMSQIGHDSIFAIGRNVRHTAQDSAPADGAAGMHDELMIMFSIDTK